MNNNPPKDTTNSNECPLPVIINIQPEHKTGIIKTATGKKFPVTLQDWLVNDIRLMDHVEIHKSHVTGEWVVTDYFVNVEFCKEIEESYLTPCERGVLL